MGRRTLLLIASILVAAAGTALVWLYVQEADSRAQATMRLVTVWQATSTIEPGLPSSALDATKVTARQIPQMAAPADRVNALADLRGQTTKQTIYKGQVLIAAQFAAPGTTATVQQNRVGVAVRMDDPNRVAGLLSPGSKVAVYWLPAGGGKGEGAGGANPQVRVLLPSATVLAIGAATTATNDDGTAVKVNGAAAPAAVITLDVVGKDAARVILAQANGTLYFTLLGPGSTGDQNDDTTLPALLNG